MTQVLYYKEGRGLLRLSCRTVQAIEAGVQQARQLVDAEAVVHQHGVLRWHRGAGITFARCAQCGHTAVVTRCGERLFVDSCLQRLCQPSLAHRPAARWASAKRTTPRSTSWQMLWGHVD